MQDYPGHLAPINHVEPVPRRVRGYIAGKVVFDTVRARYVWEIPPYPQYYVPLDDIDPAVLVDEGRVQHTRRGAMQVYGLRVGDDVRPAAARLCTGGEIPDIAGTMRFDWAAIDTWLEEDEQIFVHPRSPFARVDALRSTRPVRIELDRVVLAETRSPVMLFETGLPTRYYLNRTDVRLDLLTPSSTVTACPYKGTTSRYWSATIAGTTHTDLAWTYDFPTHQLPIAGLIAFFNERVDTFLDGALLERPVTHFSRTQPQT